MKIAVLIVAAGRGSRAGGPAQGLAPKQYRLLAGQPVIRHAITAFAAHPDVTAIQAVLHPDDGDLYSGATRELGLGSRLLPPVCGGATRQESVRHGLEALAVHAPECVLIHDAARPLVDPETISRVIGALLDSPGAIAGVPVVDTLKRAGGDNHIAATVDRAGLWRAQTPQGFRFAAIVEAHRKAHAAGSTHFTDDSQIAEWAGVATVLVAGNEENFKVTTESDLDRASLLLSAHAGETRTGTGFDVHRFTAGDHVWLGGVRIAHTHALEGHSDADVVLHALTDAILGALGDGDIGQHFPPSDPQWKGAPSRVFLADAARRVRERGGVVTNVDVTVLCEAPRIGPERAAMRSAIGAILAIEPGRVGVKATTTEGLGFTGRREGIAAMATATLRLKS